MKRTAALLLWAFLLPLARASRAADTATPIKHLVILFQENVSFDHYFATYPNALNKPGEPEFKPLANTPTINGLTGPLLTHNPNKAAPMRLGRDQAPTCDQDHAYDAEQKAAHGGLMDRFVEHTGASYGSCDPKQVMGYFDGNTVSALWNYAQHYAMSDNFFGTNFGPSTVGAINLVSGNTHGATPAQATLEGETVVVDGAVVGDPRPEFDDCSNLTRVRLSGTNVGDLLNRKGVSWGFFEGGFRPSTGPLCDASHAGSDGKPKKDYLPHHEPFQFYKATSNPHHLPPSAPDTIGLDDQANHQYDLTDFWTAAEHGRMPAVSILKAPAYQDGHAGYSDPLQEQRYIVETMNRLQALPEWKDMAIVIAYDDSDGWYDHVAPPIVRHSKTTMDALDAIDACGDPAPGEHPGRCGYGPRLPLLIVSPFSKTNYVDHAITDQASILRFVEDNWSLGRIGDQSSDEYAGSILAMFDFARKAPAAKFKLDPQTGQPGK